MPIRYVCRKCGYELWSFERVGQDYLGVLAPEDIIRVFGVCPRCKNDLSIPKLEDIVIELRVRHPVVVSDVSEISVLVKTTGEEAVQET